MAKGVGGIIQGLIFLALIAGVIVGAKMFYFDPLQQQKALQKTRTEVTALIDEDKFDEAFEVIDKLEKNHPKQKKFCKERRFTIYREMAGDEFNSMTKNQEKWVKYRKKDKDRATKYMNRAKEHAQACIDSLGKAEELGDLGRGELQWLSLSHNTLGNKNAAKAAMKRQGQLPKE